MFNEAHHDIFVVVVVVVDDDILRFLWPTQSSVVVKVELGIGCFCSWLNNLENDMNQVRKWDLLIKLVI